MVLTTPIHKLKRRATELQRTERLRRFQSLDRGARDEGFASWSHLATLEAQITPNGTCRKALPGEALLIGARPGQGKTRFALSLAHEAMEARPELDEALRAIADIVTDFCPPDKRVW